MECAWQVEIDQYCQKVLTRHWPDVPKFGDIREVGAHNLPPVDVIAGGFPCQDISFAGKGAGIEEGTRSGLWFEYLRIIRELRPRYVIVENVAALLGRGIDRVLGDLAESGYDAEWNCISAASIGACHKRERIFIIAYMADSDRVGRAVWGDGPLQYDGVIGAARRDNPQGAHADDSREWWETEPGVDRVADGIPSRLDRLRGLGNAVVPQVAEFVGRMVIQHDQV